VTTGAGPAIVLTYHRIAAEGPDPHGLQVSPDRFRTHLDVLRSRAAVVPVEAVLEPGAGPRVAITFDDGYRDNLAHAEPILQQFDVPATLFVVSGLLDSRAGFWIDRLASVLLAQTPARSHLRFEVRGTPYILDVTTTEARDRAYRFLQHRLSRLSPAEIEVALGAICRSAGVEARVPESALPLTGAQLRELAARGTVSIGAHTVTHPRLSSLADDQQRDELRRSRADLEALLGRPVGAFAYPYGGTDAINDTSVRLARETFDLAVTTEPGAVDAGTDRFRIPRFHVTNWTADEFAPRLDAWLRGAQ